MYQDKYLISYDWRNPMGMYVFCNHYSTNSLLKFVFKFITTGQGNSPIFSG